MTDENGIKLRELLPDRAEKLGETLREHLATDSESKHSGMVLGFVESQAMDAIGAILDLDLFEVLARAWGVARELREYRDEKKHPPQQTSTVSLGKHEFLTSVHPVLTYSVMNLPPRSLRLTLELKVRVSVATLEIKERRIQAARVGECQVTAQLKYNAIPLHAEKKSKTIKLSRRYLLKSPGIEIAGAKI